MDKIVKLIFAVVMICGISFGRETLPFDYSVATTLVNKGEIGIINPQPSFVVDNYPEFQCDGLHGVESFGYPARLTPPGYVCAGTMNISCYNACNNTRTNCVMGAYQWAQNLYSQMYTSVLTTANIAFEECLSGGGNKDDCAKEACELAKEQMALVKDYIQPQLDALIDTCDANFTACVLNCCENTMAKEDITISNELGDDSDKETVALLNSVTNTYVINTGTPDSINGYPGFHSAYYQTLPMNTFDSGLGTLNHITLKITRTVVDTFLAYENYDSNNAQTAYFIKAYGYPLSSKPVLTIQAFLDDNYSSGEVFKTILYDGTNSIAVAQNDGTFDNQGPDYGYLTHTTTDTVVDSVDIYDPSILSDLSISGGPVRYKLNLHVNLDFSYTATGGNMTGLYTINPYPMVTVKVVYWYN